jgi:hypothetical protein
LTSEDFVKFSVTVAGYEVTVLRLFFESMTKISSGASDAKPVSNVVKELVNFLVVPEIFRLLPEGTRVCAHRGELYEVLHSEWYTDPYGLRDEPHYTKHAQEGATFEDFGLIRHSGFGSCCNPSAKAFFPKAGSSLTHFVKTEGGSTLAWLKMRLDCAKLYVDLDKRGSTHAGICVACDFIMTDTILNGAWGLQECVACEEEEEEAEADGQDDMADGQGDMLARFFEPRPQEGFWFPNVVFKRKRNWDMVVGVDVLIHFVTDWRKSLSCKGSRFLTIVVQSQSHANWPDGQREYVPKRTRRAQIWLR